MILLFIAFGLLILAAGEWVLRSSIKRRAEEMTDEELKNEIYMGNKFGCGISIFCDEMDRRDVARGMLERAS